MLEITPDLAIPDDELDERFIQASGPGGQNVNKVATAVQFRFDAAGSQALSPEVRERLLRAAGSRMTADGGCSSRHAASAPRRRTGAMRAHG